MSSTSLTFPLRVSKLFGIVRWIFGVCLLAIFTVEVISLGGVSESFLQFLVVCSVFFVLLVFVRSSGKTLLRERESVLSSTLVIWVFLMVSEAVFVHNQSTDSAASGNVGASALYQTLSWILSLVVLGLITCFRPAYLRRLFAGQLKW